MRLYVDMDGVLADFDTGYENAFGVKPSKIHDNVDWDLVRSNKDFYRAFPEMPDAQDLWRYIHHYDPIILTGLPKSIGSAKFNKHSWVREHFGSEVESKMVCCFSAQKYQHCLPGDILIDDWIKYQDRWVKAGGIWITHTNAERTIKKLQNMGL